MATDGTLDPDRAADAVARCHDEGDRVFVFTALNVPADFLRGLGRSGVKVAADIAREAGHPMSSGDRAAERLAPVRRVSETQPDDSGILTAMSGSATARTQPILDALAKRGIAGEGLWRTTENQTARAIIQTAAAHDCDLVIIGSHGGGRFDGLLGSTGTKVVRRCPADVFVLRTNAAR